MGRSIGALGSLAALALVEGQGRAQQLDLNPPLPDVLLLVDNSGSMERMIDGSLPEDNAANACDVSSCTANSNGTTCTWAAAAPVAANRWNTLLQALVGSPVNGFHCISMPRTASSPFTDEYQINGTFPYDTGYYLNYHRMVAKDTSTNVPTPCVYAPGSLPGAAQGSGVGLGKFGAGGSADAFPSSPPPIITRPYGQTLVDQNTKTMSCQFTLNNDGALVQYQDLMRFALMTFDQDPGAKTGVSASYPYTPAIPNPFDGMWSYFQNWGGTGTAQYASGNPAGCSVSSPFEVGARNPAAPPWEGRLMGFPAPTPPLDTVTARQTQNQQIRQVLSATRAYGGTPLAGMFSDAQYYFWSDPSGPNGSATPINGSSFATYDPYIQAGCRKQFIILLTDGAPNQDLRESCGTADNPSAPCPYNHPEYTAQAMLNGTGGHQSITTYVIGFAVSSGKDQGGTLVQCNQLDPNGSDCVNPTPALAPCCELQKIAIAGAPPAANGLPAPHAYFANTPGDLQSALGAILAQIAQQTTTRTVPSFSPVTSNIAYTANSSASNQNTFYSSFNPARPVPAGSVLGSAGAPWTGDIQRSRYVCSQSPPTQPMTPALGDDFRQDLATSTARNFISFQPTPKNGVVDAAGTFRPWASTTVGDGLGAFSGSGVGTQINGAATDIVTAMLNTSPSPLGLPSGANACQYTSDQGKGQPFLTQTDCTTMLLDFTMGQPFTGPYDFPFVSRAGINAFGGIFHATPVVVGPPSSVLRDDAYDQFRIETQTTTPQMGAAGSGTRDTIAYAATTDGLLHAFWTDVSQLTQNEEWAFMPPAVMPQLKASYPASDQFLLDGTPIIRDVVWNRPKGSTMNGGNNPWRTTLVASFGPTQQGFYALDITNPVFRKNVTPSESTSADPQGPTFLWQLTKMPGTNLPLFGHHGATPAITQIALGNPPQEVGVAILPGGWDTAAQSGGSGCQRDTIARSLTTWGVPATDTVPYTIRNNVRCWGANGQGSTDVVFGRSVTVVRLDTGEIVATFVRKYDAQHFYPNDTLLNANPTRIIDTPLDSPMTGTPAVYPNEVGVEATKFFIADMDGTIWRFDISNPDPTQWVGKVFYDLYNTTADPVTTTSWNDGQPVALPLLTSLDRQGRLVIHVASGAQDTFDTSGPNFLVSLTEKIQTVGSTPDFHAAVNWYMGSKVFTGGTLTTNGVMDQGERVSGPMIVFDNKLYFTTFSANVAAASVCSQGAARLWGADYINPNGSAAPPNQGGLVVGATTGSNPYLDLTANGVAPGVVVPGVSVQQSTACAQVTSGSDQYVAGATHSSLSSYSAGTFSLVMSVGASNTTGGAQVKNISIPAPSSPALIDSWAAVTE